MHHSPQSFTKCTMSTSREPEHQAKRCTNFFFCLLLGVLIHIVLLLTVFQAVLHVHDPKARISQVVTQQHLHVNFSSNSFQDIKLVTQVTLHNPALANFRFRNGSLAYRYRGNEIGLGSITGIQAKGRSIKILNGIINVLNSNSVAEQDFSSYSDDIYSGLLSLSGQLKLDGEIVLMKVIRRKAIVETHCDVVLNLVLQDIEIIKCK